MPVTLISSNAAGGRAYRLPGVAAGGGMAHGAMASRAQSLTARLRRRGVGSDREAQRLGIGARSAFPGAHRAGGAAVVLVGAGYWGPACSPPHCATPSRRATSDGSRAAPSQHARRVETRERRRVMRLLVIASEPISAERLRA